MVVEVEQVVLENHKWNYFSSLHSKSFSKSNFFTSFSSTYPITVGGGGTGNYLDHLSPSAGGSGSNSVFSTITSTGGGGGGSEMLQVQLEDGGQVDQVEAEVMQLQQTLYRWSRKYTSSKSTSRK
jgi:hypothetical protein